MSVNLARDTFLTHLGLWSRVAWAALYMYVNSWPQIRNRCSAINCQGWGVADSVAWLVKLRCVESKTRSWDVKGKMNWSGDMRYQVEWIKDSMTSTERRKGWRDPRLIVYMLSRGSEWLNVGSRCEYPRDVRETARHQNMKEAALDIGTKWLQM
jgi:hypothetical protein